MGREIDRVDITALVGRIFGANLVLLFSRLA